MKFKALNYVNTYASSSTILQLDQVVYFGGRQICRPTYHDHGFYRKSLHFSQFLP